LGALNPQVAERAELDYGLFAFEENFHSVSGKVNGTDITRSPAVPSSREATPHAAASAKN
jgi:hypothetical protein